MCLKQFRWSAYFFLKKVRIQVSTTFIRHYLQCCTFYENNKIRIWFLYKTFPASCMYENTSTVLHKNKNMLFTIDPQLFWKHHLYFYVVFYVMKFNSRNTNFFRKGSFQTLT